MENILRNRLSEVVSDIGIDKIVKKLDKSEKTILRYIKMQSDISFTDIIKIAELANINIEWLATGKGDKYPKSAEEAQDIVSSDEFYLIPHYDIEVSAGHGAFSNGEAVKNTLAFRQSWFTYNNINKKDAVAIRAKGDSMEPTIPDGAMILVDKSQKNIELSGLYILIIGEMAVVKRVEKQFDGSIAIISDNKNYEKQIIPAENTNNIIIAGRVRWIGQTIA